MHRCRATYLSIVLALLVALTLPAVALATSYYSSLWVAALGGWSGANRSYSGSNMHITCNTHSAGSGNYRVSLVRHSFWSDSTIGTVNMPRNGSGSGAWTSVGSGTYHFYFNNSAGNYDINCDANQVHMWSN
jgi:hypothetical protein